MSDRRNGNKIYWTYERCKEEALKYDTKKEFYEQAPSVRVIAKRRGWYEEITSHMIPLGHRYLRCIYSYEFSDNHFYVGLTCNLNRRHVERFTSKNDAVNKHKLETGEIPVFKQLTEYLPPKEAQEKEGEYLNKYINLGWVKLNIAKTGGLGSGDLYWTKERCLEAAKKCKTRQDFKTKFRGAHGACLKFKWWAEIKQQMEGKKSNRKWTKDACAQFAQKCQTRAEFKKNYIRAFNAAYNHKWLDDICKHMRRKRKLEIKNTDNE